MRCSIKAREKQKANQKGQQGNNKYPFPADWANGKRKQHTKFKSKKGQKGKGSTAEEAIIPETEAMKANGWNLPISHLMTPGKLPVPPGTGMQKLIGKQLKSITRTGRRLRTGNIQQAGLPLYYSATTQEKTS